MSKVYVTQLPHRRDSATGQLVPIFNINPAHEFGEMVFIMPPQAHYQPTAQLVESVAAAVRDYDHSEGDSLLLLGDTVLIAVTIMVLARRHSRLAVLRWDRNLGRYIRTTVVV